MQNSLNNGRALAFASALRAKQSNNTIGSYRWNIRVLWWKVKIKEEETILVRSSICPGYHSPQEIHSIFIHSHIDPICKESFMCYEMLLILIFFFRILECLTNIQDTNALHTRQVILKDAPILLNLLEPLPPIAIL